MTRKKIVLNDVAKLAGVGIATVDRLLNERGNVKPETALRIIRAVRQLGLQRILPHPITKACASRSSCQDRNYR
ncbi:MAG: LacI family DNA-binding transcriptional regulator [Phyllobacterium sp.]|jgi:LacI family transcriptional regulator|uniref:LacI family DNA-binding transcriptional regulator n=1 Tax=Phyllobacterium sp. TaxID=1871046 RepID=UPI0030F18C6C